MATIFVAFITIGAIGPIIAATTPSLWDAARFGILSSTFSITASTTVNWDVGYTTLSNPWLTILGGSIFIPSPPQAGTDQGVALTALSAWANATCDFTFAPWAIDLATDTTHGTIWIYTGGVYCINGAASIWTAGITLSGAGTYIFRINGALTTVDNSIVTLNGASACDVFWLPIAATTLGATTTFIGTVIDDAGITVGNKTSWIGRALAYAQTVTTDTATITNLCGGTAGTGTLHVIKTVIGGTAIASGFNLYVNYNWSVIWSGVGTGWLGTLYSLTAGTYTVSEDTNSSYTQSLSANCLNVTLLSGDDKTCTITNTYIIPPWGGGWGTTLTKDNCPDWDYSNSYYDGKCWIVPVVITGSVVIGSIVTGSVVTGSVVIAQPTIGTVVVVTPSFPKTWLSPEWKNVPRTIIILAGLFIVVFTPLVIVRKKGRI